MIAADKALREQAVEFAPGGHQVPRCGQLIDPLAAPHHVASLAKIVAYLVELRALRGVEISAIRVIAEALAQLEIAGGKRALCLHECCSGGGAAASRDPAMGLGAQLARPGHAGDQRPVWPVWIEDREGKLVVPARERVGRCRDCVHRIDERTVPRTLVVCRRLLDPL